MVDLNQMRFVRFSASSNTSNIMKNLGASSPDSPLVLPTPLPRWEDYQGISHLVIPVIALLGDIAIYPMGAECYELVPEIVLNSAPMSWNGHPILADHPNDGESGACTPEILSRDQFGIIFNSYYDDDSHSLQMEAWLNPERAMQVGPDAIQVFDRCASGDILEISVGAYIRLISSHGVARNGREYDLAWTLIHPDHLAIGLRGKEGACSNQEGCGTNRSLVNADGTHKYSSTQVDLTGDLRDKILALGQSIPDELIVESVGGDWEGGRESNPHVTIKYGLHDSTPDNLIELLESESSPISSITLTLGDLDIFEADTYDVLYAQVISQDLVKLSGVITSGLEVTNTQPTYTPHVTIAYIAKGAGARYVGNSTLSGLQITCSEMIFSSIDGSKTTIDLPIMGKEARMAAQMVDGKKTDKKASKGVVAQLMKSIRSLMSMMPSDQAEEDGELIGYELMKSLSDSAKSHLTQMDAQISSLIAGEVETPTETREDEDAEEVMEDARLQAIRSYCFAIYSTIGGILDQASSMRIVNDNYGYGGYTAGSPESRAAAGKRNSKKDQQELQKAHDHLANAGAECSPNNMPKNMTSGTQKSPCGCAKLSQNSDGSNGEEENEMAIEKDKMKELIGRLLKASGTPEDAALIKAEFGIDATASAVVVPVAPAVVPVAAAAAKPTKTPEEIEAEYLASAPASVRSLVTRAKQQEAEARAGMIRQLTGAQTHYDEKALATMSTDFLTGLVSVMGLNAPAPRVNYLGLGLPNPNGDGANDAKALEVYGAPPSGIAEYAAASRGEKAKAN